MGPRFCASLHLSFSLLTLLWPKSPFNAPSGVSAWPKTGQFSNGGIIKQKTTALPTLATAVLLVSDWTELCLLLSTLSLCVCLIFESAISNTGKVNYWLREAQLSPTNTPFWETMTKKPTLKSCLASLSVPRAALVPCACALPVLQHLARHTMARHGKGTCSLPSLEPKSHMQCDRQCHSNFGTWK